MNAARLLFASALVGLLACSSSSSGPGTGTTPGEDTGVAPTEDTGTVPTEDTTPVEEDTTPALEYPPAPYGLKVGNIFPNFAFKGYKQGVGEWTDMTMLDHYDPDGSRGVTGIYFVVTAQWCPPCNTEADHLPLWWTTSYKDRGARVLSAVIEDSTHKPATQLTVDQWVKRHKINFDIMLDSASDSLPKVGTVGLPYNYLIDPRTMKVVRIIQGIDPAVSTGCTSDDNCCKTAVSPDVCYQDYSCSLTLKTCLTPSMAGPITGLDALMIRNGATAFDTGLKK
jgi:hypothetical protein